MSVVLTYTNTGSGILILTTHKSDYASLDNPDTLDGYFDAGYVLRSMDYSIVVGETGGSIVAHLWIGHADESYVLVDFGNVGAGTLADTVATVLNVFNGKGTVRLNAKYVSGDPGDILAVYGGDFDATVTLVLPAVTVVSPNGGEEWRIGETHDITWDETDCGTVAIALYKGGVFDSTIASGVTASDESYSWTIPATVASGFDYKIRVTVTDSEIYDESNAAFTIAEEGTAEVVVPAPEDPDDPAEPWPPYYPPDLKSLVPTDSTLKGLWVRVKGTVYWETETEDLDEPDSLDLVVRFRDNEGYVGKALIAGKDTYWCPKCGWTWGGDPGAVCPQCGEATEAHPLWTTGGGSGQTFDYIFGGTDFAAVTEGAPAYILPPNRCVLVDAGFGIEFQVRSSDTVRVDDPVMREGFVVSTDTLTIEVDYVSVMVFYEE